MANPCAWLTTQPETQYSGCKVERIHKGDKSLKCKASHSSRDWITLPFLSLWICFIQFLLQPGLVQKPAPFRRKPGKYLYQQNHKPENPSHVITGWCHCADVFMQSFGSPQLTRRILQQMWLEGSEKDKFTLNLTELPINSYRALSSTSWL